MTRTIAFAVVSLSLSLSLFTGCSTAPSSDAGRASLHADADQTIADAKKNDSTLNVFFDKSAGYAVFPSVGKGAIGIGGAYGRGILYQAGKVVGYCDLSQATVGLQLGGQAYSEIIFFETNAAVEHFKSGNFAFSAQATAVALKSGSGANAKYANGVAVFTLGEAGLMYEASIGGQKFTYRPQ